MDEEVDVESQESKEEFREVVKVTPTHSVVTIVFGGGVSFKRSVDISSVVLTVALSLPPSICSSFVTTSFVKISLSVTSLSLSSMLGPSPSSSPLPSRKGPGRQPPPGSEAARRRPSRRTLLPLFV